MSARLKKVAQKPFENYLGETEVDYSSGLIPPKNEIEFLYQRNRRHAISRRNTYMNGYAGAIERDGGMYFDGVDDYVLTRGYCQVNSSYSVFAHFRLQSAPSSQSLVSCERTSPYNKNFNFWLDATGDIGLERFNTSNNPIEDVRTTGAHIVEGGTYYACATWDNTSGTDLYLYNEAGVLLETVTSVDTTTNNNNTTVNIMIGAQQTNNSPLTSQEFGGILYSCGYYRHKQPDWQVRATGKDASKLFKPCYLPSWGVDVGGAAINITGTEDTLAISENTATNKLDAQIAGVLDTLVITENNAPVVSGLNIDAITQAFVITEQTASIDININAVSDSVAISENTAAIKQDLEIVTVTDDLVIGILPAGITVSVGGASLTEDEHWRLAFFH